MKKTNIVKAIKANEALLKSITNCFNWVEDEDKAIDMFIESAQDWIKAIRKKSMLCIVKNVSKSGMSRNFYYTAFIGNGHRSFYSFLTCLGYRMKGDCVVIGGCGMDMNFNTNYNIICKLHMLGFISLNDRDILCQLTPNCI